MQAKSIEGIKFQLDQFRNNLEQEFEDETKRVKIKINGHFKILALNVPEDLLPAEIEHIVPELLTKSIESIGNSIRKKLEEMQTVPH